MIRRLVLAIAIFGLALCAAMLWVKPAVVEAWAERAIVAEAGKRVQDRAPALAEPARASVRSVDGAFREAAARHVGKVLARAEDTPLAALVKARHAEVSAALLREFRIFFAANATVFLLLACLAGAWRGRPRQLLAPTVVLLGAACIVAGCYLLTQDWLQTVLLGDYVGFWYFPYLGIALLFMCDLVFNHARISEMLVSAALEVFGAAVSAVA